MGLLRLSALFLRSVLVVDGLRLPRSRPSFWLRRDCLSSREMGDRLPAAARRGGALSAPRRDPRTGDEAPLLETRTSGEAGVPPRRLDPRAGGGDTLPPPRLDARAAGGDALRVRLRVATFRRSCTGLRFRLRRRDLTGFSSRLCLSDTNLQKKSFLPCELE